jgi:hypothetical protein
MLDLEVRHRGSTVARLTAEADPRDGNDLLELLLGAIRRRGGDDSQVSEYEMDLRDVGEREVLTTFVASSRRR